MENPDKLEIEKNIRDFNEIQSKEIELLKLENNILQQRLSSIKTEINIVFSTIN